MEDYELYVELLSIYLRHYPIEVTFPGLPISAQAIVELESYKALRKIKDVIEDDTLDDVECFERIEKIVKVFEELDENCVWTRLD